MSAQSSTKTSLYLQINLYNKINNIHNYIQYKPTTWSYNFHHGAGMALSVFISYHRLFKSESSYISNENREQRTGTSDRNTGLEPLIGEKFIPKHCLTAHQSS